jgi:hypothetical protein
LSDWRQDILTGKKMTDELRDQGRWRKIAACVSVASDFEPVLMPLGDYRGGMLIIIDDIFAYQFWDSGGFINYDMIDADNADVLWEERNWLPFNAPINDIAKKILKAVTP